MNNPVLDFPTKPKKLLGKVFSYNHVDGFGFITSPAGVNYFFSKSQIKKNTSVLVGQYFLFNIRAENSKLWAKNLDFVETVSEVYKKGKFQNV